jgi:flagellar basal-body rod modification protein FlgD
MAPVTNSHTTPSTGQTTPKPAAGQVDKNMFMQLLVAQLRNQNPLNPTDSMAFVQQLAQFQQMEQSVNTGQDIAAIRQDLEKLTAATPDSHA